MREFRVEGTFQAENIDHALDVLSVHFASVLDGNPDGVADLGYCDIKVAPADSDEWSA